MSAEIQSLSQLNQKATQILVKEMGIVDAIRFLNQFTVGSGDYTKDREQWLGDLPLEQVIKDIKSKRAALSR